MIEYRIWTAWRNPDIYYISKQDFDENKRRFVFNYKRGQWTPVTSGIFGNDAIISEEEAARLIVSGPEACEEYLSKHNLCPTDVKGP